MRQLQTPELASKVLNDLMDGVLKTDRRANSSEIILDESTAVVIGVVSQRYVGYSNEAFLRDVLICLDEDNNGALFPNTSDFIFKVAYSINSTFSSFGLKVGQRRNFWHCRNGRGRERNWR